MGFGIDRWLSLAGPDKTSVAVLDLWSMLRNKTLRLPTAAICGLDQYGSALATDAAPGSVGKVILE